MQQPLRESKPSILPLCCAACCVKLAHECQHPQRGPTAQSTTAATAPRRAWRCGWRWPSFFLPGLQLRVWLAECVIMVVCEDERRRTGCGEVCSLAFCFCVGVRFGLARKTVAATAQNPAPCLSLSHHALYGHEGCHSDIERLRQEQHRPHRPSRQNSHCLYGRSFLLRISSPINSQPPNQTSF